MILVTNVKEYNNRKQKVELENGFTFCLYNREIKRFNIRQEEYISEEILGKIVSDVLVKRCRERAFQILKASSKTKKQMKDKLMMSNYPMLVIDKTIEFLEEYNYINDIEFARCYIESRKNTKSKSRIKNELIQKGIQTQDICDVMEELIVDDTESFYNTALKNVKKYNINDAKERKRFIMMLQRKGYSYDLIGNFLKKL